MGRTVCTEPQCLYSRAIPLFPPMGRTACTEPQCLYSRAIPLLSLWAVQSVQNLSACTVELYLYSPYGPYGLYRTSVSVKGCTFFIQLMAGTGYLSGYRDSLEAGQFGDRNPVKASFFPTVQTGPGAYPAYYIMGTGSFPGVKRPGRGVDPPI